MNMSVPDYKVFMRVLMELVSDGREYTTKSLYREAADRLGLSDEDRAMLLPSGRQAVYRNRAGWAKTHLSKAGLLASPARGVVRITERGLEALNSGAPVSEEMLMQYEEYQEFRGKKKPGADDGSETGQSTDVDDLRTPEEQLEHLFGTVTDALAADLLDAVRSASPVFFEQLVVELLVAMGYGGSVADAGRALGRSGDNGIDGIVKQDRLGLEHVYVQAKRWAEGRSVTSGEVRDLAGALQLHKASKGVLMSTSGFTRDAVSTAERLGNIVLVNGVELAQLMIEFNIGVTTTRSLEIKRLDDAYFEEDA